MKNKIIAYLNNKPELRHFIIYGLIGGTSALIDTLFYIVMSKTIPIEILVINFISVNIGITISFFLNANINFKVKDHLGKRAIKFYLVGYIGLLLSELILYVFVKKLGLNEILIKLASVFVVACLQFILNRAITFKKGEVK